MKLAAESLIESDNPVLAVTTWCGTRRAPTPWWCDTLPLMGSGGARGVIMGRQRLERTSRASVHRRLVDAMQERFRFEGREINGVAEPLQLGTNPIVEREYRRSRDGWAESTTPDFEVLRDRRSFIDESRTSPASLLELGLIQD